MSDRNDRSPQVLHLVIHADPHLLHFIARLFQQSTGLSQQAIDELTERMKASNDSLEVKLSPPA